MLGLDAVGRLASAYRLNLLDCVS